MLIKNVKCDSNWKKCNRHSAWHKITAHTWSGAYLLGNGGAQFRRFTKVLSKMLRVPFAGILNQRVSEWSNPSNGPPLYPLNYGTPKKVATRMVIVKGITASWASRLITLRIGLYQRLLQPC